MSIQIHRNYDENQNQWMLKIVGEIDIYTAGQIKENLLEMMDEHLENIRIDCTELSYIDSTGLGVLIGALKKLRKQDKDIIIQHPRQNVCKLFSITGLNQIFIIEGE